jgi:hypothetical protein
MHDLAMKPRLISFDSMISVGNAFPVAVALTRFGAG